VYLNSVTFHPGKYPRADCYPFNLKLFQRTCRLVFSKPVTLFVGENGTGKSTLLEAITRCCGIHIWRETGRRRVAFNPCADKLHQCLTAEAPERPVPGSFFGSSIFQQFAELLDDWAASDPALLEYFGGRVVLTQSHGESLLSYFQSRYRRNGLYLLDEPETALSPGSQLKLLDVLAGAGRGNPSQFIIATHSPLLLACPGAALYGFDGDTISPTRYEETEHYRIYRDFMKDRTKYLGRE